MLQFAVGLVLVGLVLAYGLRWLWWPSTARRISPKGKAFVVTGAASGFGKEVTKMLAEQGGYVFAVDLNEELLLAEWKDNPNVHTRRVDVTDTKSIEALVQEVKDSGKGIFGLFNNAGIGHPSISIVDCPEELMVRTMNVNCFGIYRMTKAFFPLLKEENEKLKAAGEGTCSIVNMTSMAGLIALPLVGAYCISKHAAEALNAVLRRELSPFGIRVSAIEPTFSNTPIMVAARQRLEYSEKCWEELGEAQATILDNTTLLDPVSIATMVVNALLNDPAPAQTIIASAWETFIGKVLIHVLPHKALDSALTEGFLDRAKKLREKKEGHHRTVTTGGVVENVEKKDN